MSGLIAWTRIYTNGQPLDSEFEFPDGPELMEIGLFITNDTYPFEFRGAVNHILSNYLTGPEMMLTMTDDVCAFHEHTGLNDIYRNVTAWTTPEAAEYDIIEMLERKGNKGDYTIACEPWVIDWIETWFPQLGEWFEYRRFDLDSVRQVFAMSGVDVLEVEQEFGGRCAQQAHRDYEEFLRYVDCLKPTLYPGGEDDEES